jgi:hypothetical protein
MSALYTGQLCLFETHKGTRIAATLLMRTDNGFNKKKHLIRVSVGILERGASYLAYWSRAYSALACLRTGTSESASFHNSKNSRYALLAFAVSPASAKPRAIPRYESE